MIINFFMNFWSNSETQCFCLIFPFNPWAAIMAHDSEGLKLLSLIGRKVHGNIDMNTHTFLCTSRHEAEAIASKSSRGIMSVAGGGNTTSVILNETCFERYSIFFGIPYLLFPNRLTSPTNPITGIRYDNIQLWIHIGLLAICLILAIINVIVQFIKTIPYGRHDKGDSNFPRIPARISFAISQFIPGILVFSLTYFFQRNFDRPSNIVMYCLFTIHYINSQSWTV